MCSCVLNLAKSKKNRGFSCGTCEDLFDSTHNRFFKNRVTLYARQPGTKNLNPKCPAAQKSA